jgi:hypothetical protein
MRRILLIVTAVLLILVLSVAVAGCRKSSGNKGGGGYLPAPTKEDRPFRGQARMVPIQLIGLHGLGAVTRKGEPL